MEKKINLKKTYRQRFPLKEHKERDNIWRSLCDYFFNSYINPDFTVIDVGAGYCEFLRAIKCKRKIAIDNNPDLKKFASYGIEIAQYDILKISSKFFNKADLVFMSNFLEHLNSKEDVLRVLKICYRLLKPKGTIIILQPNIDLTHEKYWSFIDHKIPLNGSSVIEALQLSGFKMEKFIERFLPYTTKSNLPKNKLLIRIYLKIPSIVKPLAGQSLFIASKA